VLYREAHRSSRKQHFMLRGFAHDFAFT